MSWVHGKSVSWRPHSLPRSALAYTRSDNILRRYLVPVMFVLSGCGVLPQSETRHYRLDVEALIDGVPARGHGVLGGTITSPILGLPDAGYGERPFGDAIKLTVEGRNIYVLLRMSGSTSDDTFEVFPWLCDEIIRPRRDVGEPFPDRLRTFSQFQGSCTPELKATNTPQLVEVPKLSDPSQIVALGPQAGGECVGTCVTKVVVTMTDEPVTRWIASDLRWLQPEDGAMSVAGSGIPDEERAGGGVLAEYYNQDFSK